MQCSQGLGKKLCESSNYGGEFDNEARIQLSGYVRNKRRQGFGRHIRRKLIWGTMSWRWWRKDWRAGEKDRSAQGWSLGWSKGLFFSLPPFIRYGISALGCCTQCCSPHSVPSWWQHQARRGAANTNTNPANANAPASIPIPQSDGYSPPLSWARGPMLPVQYLVPFSCRPGALLARLVQPGVGQRGSV